MHIVVIGAGPAGVVAAHRLQQAGHRVELIEALPTIGGRTHAEHLGAGHHCDTGAGWLASFYRRTLALFDELGYRDLLIRPRHVRGAADLLANGQRYNADSSGERAAYQLFTPAERAALEDYIARVHADQPADLEVDLAYDGHSAAEEVAPLGRTVVDAMVRPWFEGPFFTPLEQMSAAMLRAWIKAYEGVTFYQVAGGMDAPWLRLAQGLDVRAGEPVGAVRIADSGVDVELRAGARRYDGAVLACPAIASAALLGAQCADVLPWLPDVRYASEVRAYAARPSAEDAAFGVHLVPPTPVYSVEFYSGRRGAWGECPPNWQWALVCASGPASVALLELPAEQARQRLWEAARQIEPALFPLAEAAAICDIRWQNAIPIIAPGHYQRLAAYKRRPPIVLAGDWTTHACVEGAVRSGELAAAAFLPAR